MVVLEYACHRTVRRCSECPKLPQTVDKITIYVAHQALVIVGQVLFAVAATVTIGVALPLAQSLKLIPMDHYFHWCFSKIVFRFSSTKMPHCSLLPPPGNPETSIVVPVLHSILLVCSGPT